MRKTRIPMPSSAHKPLKILAIDDEPVVRDSIAAYLEDSGFEVLQAGDGQEGLQKLREAAPELILLDLRMPEMDGLEFLEIMKQEAPDTPVIVVSGTGVLQDAIEALRAGAHDFVTKPILDMAVLEHAVKGALERARLRSENLRYREHLEAEIAQRTSDLVARTRALEVSNRNLQREIEQREKAEASLRSQEQKFRELADLLPQTVFETDARGAFTFMNRYAREMFAVGSEDHPAALQVGDILAPEAQASALEGIDQAMTGDGPVEFETLVRRADQTCFPAMVYASPITRGGSAVGLRGLLFDLTAIRKAEEALRESEAHLRKENLLLRHSMKDAGRFGRLIGRSPAMIEVYEVILKAADSNANVIIYGESGTGKELVAHTIHELSDRRDHRFVPVNCGAIPDNLLESEFFGYKKGAFTGAVKDKPGLLAEAEGGTLFLDEIGEIGPSLQVKLLRAIEGGGYTPIGSSEVVIPNIRIVAATNRQLQEEVRKGHLREDFYYRIHIIPIQLPPLRERREDIGMLIQHFLETFSEGGAVPVMPDHVMRSLRNRDWPGNIRELQNAVHRFLTLNAYEPEEQPTVAPASASPEPDYKAPAPPADTALADVLAHYEREHLLRVLNANHWHRSRAAHILGIDRRTLFRKIQKYGL
ncbi:MAG: sigma-54-dependent Fis family transcriptional regulator [Desulfobacterales bacterium]|jgi:PAS domain S-box-containing protein